MKTATTTPTTDPKTGEAQGAPFYYLGSTDGRTLYTAMGTFKSGMEAVDYWRSKPRSGSGVALVHEYRDAIRFEIVYGFHTAIVATATTTPTC